jgi:RimJ/RimL family protein N-acetyltransferase
MRKYKCLSSSKFILNDFHLESIRDEDKFEIMTIRNEQIYHLRQAKPLTLEDQENYFSNVVSKLFEQDFPNQMLFSFFYKNEFIGYGGLVHINWIDKNAEISFVMKTKLEQDFFSFYWSNYLKLIEKVAFEDINLHKIYTYAFDLRPHLYETLELAGYKKEAVLHEHCYFNGEFKDVVIHYKKNPIFIRNILEEDLEIVFEWANDLDSRKNSFFSDEINFNEHSLWFKRNLDCDKSDYFMVIYNGVKASIIRFDITNKEATIGINLAPVFRGKGLSSLFLNLCCQLHFEKLETQTIFAFIKPENIPSIKSFLKAGFIIAGNKELNENEALILTKTINEK